LKRYVCAALWTSDIYFNGANSPILFGVLSEIELIEGSFAELCATAFKNNGRFKGEGIGEAGKG
jgi:hypothetical protein